MTPNVPYQQRPPFWAYLFLAFALAVLAVVIYKVAKMEGYL